jgi:Pin2-interacting protein X1
MVEVALKDTLNATWKDDKSRFGFKMLQKMGWREDKGLGKHEDGIVSSVKVSKREDGLGLGMEKTSDGAGSLGWNATASSFNAVLQVLNESYGTNKDSKKKKEKKKKDVPKISVGIKYVNSHNRVVLYLF